MNQEIHTYTLGCKVNFADTQQLAENVSCVDGKNMEIIGTCCVTAEGEKQSRKEVRRASRRVGSGGKVFVTGCAATLDPSAFKNIAENVEIVTGKPEEAAKAISSLAVAECGTRERSASPSRESQRTRYFLKVQDGCGRRCSYCIIPSVRGRPVSLPVENVLNTAAGKVKHGCREIVVTGINVGAYNDRGLGIDGLLERLAHLDGLKRLRLSSIEAAYIDRRLLQVIAENRIIGRHLHIPLQSGDDAVLKSMRRSYDTGMFLKKIKMVKDAMPEINLTTDVILGFPTEDAGRFENTMRVVDEAGFTKVHVFTYSPRPGTKAGLMDDKVPKQEKKRRSLLLRELSDSLGREHRERKVGQVEEVLLENHAGINTHKGYSSDYTRYVVTGGSRNSLVMARGIRAASGSVEARLLGQ